MSVVQFTESESDHGFQQPLERDRDRKTITRLFSESVRSAAQNVAIVQDGEEITYSEIDRRSNRFARFLRRQGVVSGRIVALMTAPSRSAIVCILAVLKLRAAYAPVDPAAPRSYTDWVLRDCGATLLLSSGCCESDLSIPTMDLEQALIASSAESDEPLDDETEPGDIAYVMYTSGSTGRPKGVQIPHRAVVRLVTDQIYARFASDEVFLHAAPLAFDASTFEIWGTLLHGARGVIVGRGRASLRQIADTIRQNKVTTAWFTAGLFNLLVENELNALGHMRQILAGGDILSPSHVLKAQAALPACQLINGYGPTENTTFTCCYRIPREGWGGGPVPIGTAINGTYVRLLDDDMKSVRDGEVGMLYAGGLGLATGYMGDARRASDRFVPDPEQAAAILYRTGDLARRRPDGALDFVGRVDRQVKIDGKRVELGEIEETLRRENGIADAVVTARKNGSQSPVLAAYVKPTAGTADHAALATQLRRRLECDLPAHMRPSQIVVLDEFPLNANGKIDHARLPAPMAIASSSPVSSPVSRKDDTVRVLSDIFSGVLGVRPIGPDTNFFDLGATSLKLLQAHAAIGRTWPDVAVLALFQHPNIRDLAKAIDGQGAPVMDAKRHRAQQQVAALKRLSSRATR